MRRRDTYDRYRSLVARFNSTGHCGHPITQGEAIGYNGRLRRTVCASCWASWQAENAEAAEYEARYADQIGGGW